MDPITLATIALTLIATKATEKVGEKIGEGAIASGKRLLEVLRRKSPDTVKRLEAAKNPEVIDAEIIEEVKQVAASDPEVQAAVDATAQAMQQQLGTVVNQTQLAEKIGILIQGGYNPITIDKFEV
ncbi:MAG: hypothetical protein B0A82_09520 [Alkalinema sp. CACIAM 70d]|nr:MAG: hypothetical protein B0A82_09520 [Alkalinema sp. CACIAM 70d]